MHKKGLLQLTAEHLRKVDVSGDCGLFEDGRWRKVRSHFLNVLKQGAELAYTLVRKHLHTMQTTWQRAGSRKAFFPVFGAANDLGKNLRILKTRSDEALTCTAFLAKAGMNVFWIAYKQQVEVPLGRWGPIQRCTCQRAPTVGPFGFRDVPI